MAKKKTSKQDKLKEQFVKACRAMSRSDGSTAAHGGEMTTFDNAVGDAMCAFLELHGKPIEREMLTLIIAMGKDTAEFAYKQGYLGGHIDSMVDTGYLERSCDGLYRATQKLMDT